MTPIFTSDLFIYQPTLEILETNLTTLVLAMERDDNLYNSLEDLKEFYIESNKTKRRVRYHHALMHDLTDRAKKSDIMKNHKNAYIMQIFISEFGTQPKVLVWDGRI